MPSPESQPNPEMATPREIYEHRGEETLAARAQKLQEALAREKELAAEREDLIRRIDELRRRLSSRSQESEPEPTPTSPEAPTGPEAPAAPTPAPTSPEAPAPEAPAEGSPTPEELRRERMRKIKRNRIIKGVLITAVVLAASITIALGVSKGLFGSSGTADQEQGSIVTTDPAPTNAPDDDIELTPVGEEESVISRMTYHGMFASEDGSTYNAEKRWKYNFGQPLPPGLDEQGRKDAFKNGPMLERGPLASIYFFLKNNTDDPNFGVEGVDFDSDQALLEAMEQDDELTEKIYEYTANVIDNNPMEETRLYGSYETVYGDTAFETGDIDTSKFILKAGLPVNLNGEIAYTVCYRWVDDDGVEHVDRSDFKTLCFGQATWPVGSSTSSYYDYLPRIDEHDPSDTEWGKSGDPHGGNLVEQSDQVNPDSEVSEEQNDNTNNGNQGYVPYTNNATPGSASESSSTNSYTEFASSGILATDATTDGGRIIGGEDQATDSDGNSAMAGENAYQNSGASAGEETGDADEAGNAAQAEAQGSGGSNGEGSIPGGDNYSDSDEESIVAGGNF